MTRNTCGRTSRTLLGLLLLFLSTMPACAEQQPSTRAASTRAASTRPFTYYEQVRKDPPLHLHVVTVDLTDPRVHVVVRRAGADPDGDGPWLTTLMRPSDVAARDGLEVAVNGDFFIPRGTMTVPGMSRKVPYFVGNWAMPVGQAMSDGDLWSSRAAEPVSLTVDAAGRVTIGRLGGPPVAGVRQAVSGSQQVVTEGRNTGSGTDLAPRTAAGVDKEGRRLVLLVVDGRRPDYSAGMTLGQLGEEMVRLGCWDALNLDGGGSSSMTVFDLETSRWHAVNRPSDGHDLLLPLSVERPVANVLGIRVDNSDAARTAATRPATAPAAR